MVKSMKPGSVIVDLAVETGGNCELTQPGKVAVKHGVKIIGHYNMPSRLAADTSQLYARNVLNFLALLIDKESGELKIDLDDELVSGTLVTRDGAVVHPALAPSEPPAEKTRKPAKQAAPEADGEAEKASADADGDSGGESDADSGGGSGGDAPETAKKGTSDGE
jgi:NAD(P) transhydrogenase subunit alpha